MKTYGVKMKDIRSDDYFIGPYRSGQQSRRAANTRTRDKKMFHRRARRTSTKQENQW